MALKIILKQVWIATDQIMLADVKKLGRGNVGRIWIFLYICCRCVRCILTKKTLQKIPIQYFDSCMHIYIHGSKATWIKKSGCILCWLLWKFKVMFPVSVALVCMESHWKSIHDTSTFCLEAFKHNLHLLSVIIDLSLKIRFFKIILLHVLLINWKRFMFWSCISLTVVSISVRSYYMLRTVNALPSSSVSLSSERISNHL